MKCLRSLLLAALALVLVAADPASDKDAKLLQGTWKCVSYEEGGTQKPEVAKTIMVTINGTMLTLFDGGTNYPAPFRLDATQKPKGLDVTSIGKVAFIYDVDCETLKLGWRIDGQGRPKDFTGQATDGIMVLTRIK
jgi:uncharacterized protein (TIGR03067 family)